MKSSNSKLVLLQGQTIDGPYRNHPDTIKGKLTLTSTLTLTLTLLQII